MNAPEVQDRLRSLGNPQAAAAAARYFKTGPGEYGNGDIFLGLRAAVMHGLAKEYHPLPLDEITVLLRSPIHEDRLLALLILVRRVLRADEATKARSLPALPRSHAVHQQLGPRRLLGAGDCRRVPGRQEPQSTGSPCGVKKHMGAPDQHRGDAILHPPA